MSHTQGPWRVGRPGAIVADHPVPEVSGSEAVDYYGGHLIAESVALQNAPILAAAPEMFDALEMVRDADEDCRRDGLATLPGPARARIDAALAKAKP